MLCEEVLHLVVPKSMCPQELSAKYAICFNKGCADTDNRDKDVSLSLFAKVPFVLLRTGNTSRTLANRAFEQVAIKPNIILEVDQAATSYRLACIGLGATLVSDLNIRVTGVSENVYVFKVASDIIRRDVYIYTKNNSVLSKTIETFSDTIESIKDRWENGMK